MKYNDLKKLIEKWIKWSGEKQLKVFMKTKKTRTLFKEAISWNRK